MFCQFVGNKAKGQISKRVFQENKGRQILQKTNISYPLIRTKRRISPTCAYQGGEMFIFSENLTCFVFLKHWFWDSAFCLITDEFTLASVAVHIVSSQLICNANYITGFYTKSNTRLKWAKARQSLGLLQTICSKSTEKAVRHAATFTAKFAKFVRRSQVFWWFQGWWWLTGSRISLDGGGESCWQSLTLMWLFMFFISAGRSYWEASYFGCNSVINSI